MDGFQQPYYVRPPPPPPSAPDPNINHQHYPYPHHLQSPPILPQQTVHPFSPWYYHVSEPPPSTPHWGAPPPYADHVYSNPYVTPPVHNPPAPYHILPPHQYPQQPPLHVVTSHLPPQHHLQTQPSHSTTNQEPGHSNSFNQQFREYPVYENEEDWGAKARAYAAASSKVATDRPQQLQNQDIPNIPSFPDAVIVQKFGPPGQQQQQLAQSGYDNGDGNRQQAPLSLVYSNHGSSSVIKQEVPSSYSSLSVNEELEAQLLHHTPAYTPPPLHAADLSGARLLPPPLLHHALHLHHPSDVYAVPKKASVPKWMREEIIQKTAVMADPSTEAEADSRMRVESSPPTRSISEDEDDDAGAQRMAAINFEIKRIVTEILLKVTDRIFDKIAMEVVNEDEAAPPPEVVSVPVKSPGSGSSAPATDILGLSAYASDDETPAENGNGGAHEENSPKTHHVSNSDARNGSSPNHLRSSRGERDNWRKRSPPPRARHRSRSYDARENGSRSRYSTRRLSPSVRRVSRSPSHTRSSSLRTTVSPPQCSRASSPARGR